MNRIRTALVATFAVLLFAANAGAQANLGGAPGSCDKACLRSLADAYFAALEQSDGSVAPFADDCTRRENGNQTGGPRAAGTAAPRGATPAVAVPAGAAQAPRGGGPPVGGPAQTCAQQINNRVFYYINSIDLRRVWIADEETGLVFGMTMFRHPMEEKIFKIYNADGQLVDRYMTNQRPFDFESIHIFKIQKAQIHDIEAMGISLPLHSKNGWSDFWR